MGTNTRALNVSDRPVSTRADSGTFGAPHSLLAAASLPPPPPQVSENLVSPFAWRNRQSLRGVWEMLSYGTHAVCETSTCFGWRGFKGAATLSSRSDDVVSFPPPPLRSFRFLLPSESDALKGVSHDHDFIPCDVTRGTDTSRQVSRSGVFLHPKMPHSRLEDGAAKRHRFQRSTKPLFFSSTGSCKQRAKTCCFLGICWVGRRIKNWDERQETGKRETHWND